MSLDELPVGLKNRASEKADNKPVERKAILQSSAEQLFADCGPFELRVWRAVGLSLASLLSFAYYLVPFSAILLPIWLLVSGFSRGSLMAVGLYLFLSFCPNPPNAWILHSK